VAAHKRVVDMAQLVPFRAPGIFMRMDPDLEARICSFPQIAERIESCIRFCYQITRGDLGNGGVADRQKYLRAALAEYVSIEEVAQGDLGRDSPKIVQTDDPRLHVLRLLRHANVHSTPARIETFSRRAIWPGPDRDVEFDYVGYRIPDLNAEIRKTKQSRCYSDTDLEAMISWLDRDQSEWGIQNTIVRAAERYVEILLR
jgi:hypothetical protein